MAAAQKKIDGMLTAFQTGEGYNYLLTHESKVPTDVEFGETEFSGDLQLRYGVKGSTTARAGAPYLRIYDGMTGAVQFFKRVGR